MAQRFVPEVFPPFPIFPFPRVPYINIRKNPFAALASLLPRIRFIVPLPLVRPRNVPAAPQLAPLPRNPAPGTPGQYNVAVPPGNGTLNGVTLQANPVLPPAGVPKTFPQVQYNASVPVGTPQQGQVVLFPNVFFVSNNNT